MIVSLTDAFDFRICGTGGADVLLFNPPYVPTESSEVVEAQDVANIQGSWAGGLSGMEITNTVLDKLEVSDNSSWRFWSHPIRLSSHLMDDSILLL